MLIDYIPAKNFTSGAYVHNPPRLLKLIVIHWIVGTLDACVRWFQAPSNNKSSAHYVIGVNGEIVQMVEEENIAWHAGVSSWKDYPTYGMWQSLNPCSIGIELAGPPSSIGMKGWPKSEIIACAELCKDIHIRWPEIKIIDHSRISPAVKIDVIKGTGHPEDVFPWTELLELSGVPEA